MSFISWLEKIEKAVEKDAEDVLPEVKTEAEAAVERLIAVADKIEAVIKELEAKL